MDFLKNLFEKIRDFSITIWPILILIMVVIALIMLGFTIYYIIDDCKYRKRAENMLVAQADAEHDYLQEITHNSTPTGGRNDESTGF